MMPKLDSNLVVPSVKSFDEYIKMFDLSSEDLQQRIVAIPGGPSSFNAEGTKAGFNITSICPGYRCSDTELREIINRYLPDNVDGVIANPQNWVWSYHTSPQALKENCFKAVEMFFDDYEPGKKDGRYLHLDIHHQDIHHQDVLCLDVPDRCFDLALSSHFLFYHSDRCDLGFVGLDLDYHLAAIKEMLRVSKEVRIFPLLTIMQMQNISPYLEPVQQEFSKLGYSVSVQTVPYEFQPGGNQMLVIK